jgi:hypothetical protein
MITVITLKNTTSYAIYDNDKKIIECMDPTAPFNDVIKNLNIKTDNVKVVELDSLPDSIQKTNIVETKFDIHTGRAIFEAAMIKENSINFATLYPTKMKQFNIAPEATLDDSYFEKINNSINFDQLESKFETPEDDFDFEKIINSINFDAPNLGKYKTKTQLEIFVDDIINNEISKQSSNEPVGSVLIPKLGDLIYVEGVNGNLRIITGGVGTVAMIYDNTNSNVEDDATDEVEYFSRDEKYYYDEEFEDEEFEDDVVKNILIELEEIPGQYFSWNELCPMQEDLKIKYGYKPTMVL